MEDVAKQTEVKMQKTIEATKKHFASVRTGRASPSLLDHVTVEYYGTQVPLKQLAGISVPESKLLAVQPYDKGALKEIEKAIMKSDLGIMPKTEGGIIRLALPPLTGERRQELAKMVRKSAEESRVALRNIRREAMEALKTQEGKKEISEDQRKFKEGEIQKLTTKYTEEIEKRLKAKETEIMQE